MTKSPTPENREPFDRRPTAAEIRLNNDWALEHNKRVKKISWGVFGGSVVFSFYAND
jgi:hypothetical protein